MYSDCIEWQQARNAAGYGIRRFGGASALAHRVAYCQAHGLQLADIKGLVVRHACDNPACVSPAHLLIGTQRDNVRDMVVRGRRRPMKGESHPSAKLSQRDVDEIRAVYVPYVRGLVAALSMRFGVSSKQILTVAGHRSWRAA